MLDVDVNDRSALRKEHSGPSLPRWDVVCWLEGSEAIFELLVLYERVTHIWIGSKDTSQCCGQLNLMMINSLPLLGWGLWCGGNTLMNGESVGGCLRVGVENGVKGNPTVLQL